MSVQVQQATSSLGAIGAAPAENRYDVGQTAAEAIVSSISRLLWLSPLPSATPEALIDASVSAAAAAA